MDILDWCSSNLSGGSSVGLRGAPNIYVVYRGYAGRCTGDGVVGDMNEVVGKATAS